MEVELRGYHTITGVITQGGFVPWQNAYYWGEYYRLLYRSKDHSDYAGTSTDGSVEWRVYTDLEGNDVVR